MVACNFSSRSSVPRIGITPRTNTRRVDFSRFCISILVFGISVQILNPGLDLVGNFDLGVRANTLNGILRWMYNYCSNIYILDQEMPQDLNTSLSNCIFKIYNRNIVVRFDINGIVILFNQLLVSFSTQLPTRFYYFFSFYHYDSPIMVEVTSISHVDNLSYNNKSQISILNRDCDENHLQSFIIHRAF